MLDVHSGTVSGPLENIDCQTVTLMDFSFGLANLEGRIDFWKYKAHVYGDFNIPRVDWSTGPISSDCALLNKKAKCLKPCLCFNGLYQHNSLKNYADNILDLIASNIPIFDFGEAREPLVPVDKRFSRANSHARQKRLCQDMP